MTTLTPATKDEQILLGVVRHLPPEHIAEVIDFARFLHFREQYKVDQTLIGIAEGDARWEELLANEESQRLLELMADEVEAEIEAGLARPMVFTNDDEIATG